MYLPILQDIFPGLAHALSEGSLDDSAIRVGARRGHTRTIAIHTACEVGELSGRMGQRASSRRATEEMGHSWVDQRNGTSKVAV